MNTLFRQTVLIAFSFPALAFAQAPAPQMARVTHQAMGTQFELRIYPEAGMESEGVIAALAEDAFSKVDALEQQISNWIPESPISVVNRKAGGEPVPVSGAVMRVLQDSRDAWKESKGVFDVTVGPLLKAWGFYQKEGRLPSDEELKEALSKVGFDKVELDETNQTVRLKVPGMQVDFGGIGKGLAADCAASALKESGVKNALVDAGTSTLVAIGTPPGEPGWKVGIRSPYNKDDKPLCEVVIKDESLSTSSGSERYFEIQGKKYIHIFDPRTGKPVQTNIVSATTIAPTGVKSDALTKQFFIWSVEETKTYCAAHPNIRVILVVDRAGVPEIIRINFKNQAKG